MSSSKSDLLNSPFQFKNTSCEFISQFLIEAENLVSIQQLITRAVHFLPLAWDNDSNIRIELNFEDANVIIPSSENGFSANESHTVHCQLDDLNPLTITLHVAEKTVISEEEKSYLQTFANVLGTQIKRVQSEKEIQEEQKLLDKAYKLARIGTWEYDMIEEELHWSDITKEVHGFESDYQPDVESTIALFKEGYHRKTFKKAAMDAINHEIPFDVELKIISGKGDERWIRATGEPEYQNGLCVRFYGISQNVTARRKAEEEVALNDRRFRAMMQHGMDMIAILDEEANYKFASQSAMNVLGFAPEHFTDKNAFDFIHEEDRDRIYRPFSTLEPKESAQLTPFRFINAEGDWRWLEATVTNLSDDPAIQGYVVNSRDVTERQIKQEQIIESLKEKETLLAEVHHRVKNNLSVLTGLLQMQAANETNEEVLKRLFDSVARIHTMASIHEQLYQTNNFGSIDLAERIKLLALNIQKSFQTETEVELNFQCESVELPVSKALPCSLITNEVLTNIFKHAFGEQETGKITIKLSNTEENEHLKLTISDNGKGLPEDFNPAESSSLGLTLIDMLSEQLPAKYAFDSSEQGTNFELLFRHNGNQVVPGI